LAHAIGEVRRACCNDPLSAGLVMIVRSYDAKGRLTSGHSC
jgi:hypothetical protein